MAGNSRDRQMLMSAPPQRTTGAMPAAIPPHAPLQSGGWYRSLVRREVLGPGRYPIDFTGRRSVGTALALTAFLGPVGLCYVSATTGLLATVLAVTILAISDAGLVPLLVIWPVAMAWAAGASARGRLGRAVIVRRRYEAGLGEGVKLRLRRVDAAGRSWASSSQARSSRVIVECRLREDRLELDSLGR